MSTTLLDRSEQRVGAEIVVRAGVAAALLGSAVVHSTVVSEHYAAWLPAGIFFLGVQVAETLLALAVIFYWSSATAAAVAVTSVATLAVWLVSRTVGLPFGPAEFRSPEAIGTADLACCVLEVAAAALVIPWALHRWPVRRSSWSAWNKRTIGMASLVATVFLMVTVGGLGPARAGSVDSGHTGSSSHVAHSMSPDH